MAVQTYAVINASNVVVNLCLWDGVSDFSPGGGLTLALLSSLPAGVGIGWALVSGTWTAPAAIPQTMNLTYQLLTQLFTSAELTAIMSAAASHPVIITWLLKMVSFTGGINLSDPQVTTALTYLVSQSLVTAPRAAAIQAGTIVNSNA